MKSIVMTTSAVLLAALFCSVTLGQKTSAAFDETVDFSGYKTFSCEKKGARNPYVNIMIVEAVERELTARGLTKVDADPDLQVVYLAATDPNLRVASVPFYHVVNPAYSGIIAGSSMAMWDVTTGTLVIDLRDRKRDRIVFRGTVTEVLQHAPSADLSADAKSVSKPINKGIAKIFKKYPTSPNKKQD